MKELDELDGLNLLVFSGPFIFQLPNGREISFGKLVIGSRNGEVAKLPVSQLKTVKDTVLGMLSEAIQAQKTVFGVEKSLEGGAPSLGRGLYWLKSETPVAYSPPVRQEKPRTIQELRELAKKI